MSRLSVIIPGYNTPYDWWIRCVKSVLKAITADDEIICVDDGSKEPLTLDFLGIENDSRVTILNLEKNVGQAAARNEALAIAKGEFITFVDSDDEIIPGCYDDCFNALERHGSDIVIYGLRTVWINDGLYKENFMQERDCGIPTAQDVYDLRKALLFDYPVNKLYRRNFLLDNGIQFKAGVCPGEDMAFNLVCLLAKAKVSIIPTIGYIYYRMDGTTLSRAYAHVRETLTYRSYLWDLYRQQLPDLDVLHMGEKFSEKDILRAEWGNLWRRGANTSLVERYRFAKQNKEIFVCPIFVEMIRLIIFRILRRYFYIRPLRRWHIKRMYPYVKEFK